MQFPLVDISQGSIISDLMTFQEIPVNSHFTKVIPVVWMGGWGHVVDGSYIADKIIKDSQSTVLELFPGQRRPVEVMHSRLWEERKWVLVTHNFKAKSLFNNYFPAGHHESGLPFH